MHVPVEKAGKRDIPALIELMHQFYAEADYALDRKWAEASFEQLLTNEALGGAWIARRDTEAAGYVVLAFKHSMEFGGLSGHIDDLFVRTKFRRQGIGSALVNALFETCRKLGVVAVHVEVGPSNSAAQSLYRAAGLALVSGRQGWAISLKGERHAV